MTSGRFWKLFPILGVYGHLPIDGFLALQNPVVWGAAPQNQSDYADTQNNVKN